MAAMLKRGILLVKDMRKNTHKIPASLTLALALAGCTTFGYIKDHPEVNDTESYEKVKEWAYEVSDGYSSRGTINRYSLYWGAGMAAAGAGTLAGLGTTGASGNASVIVPLAAAFLGSVFGYYQNEEQAQLYFAASDSIKALIDQSNKRRQTVNHSTDLAGSAGTEPGKEKFGKLGGKLNENLAYAKTQAQDEKYHLEMEKAGIGKRVSDLLPKDPSTKPSLPGQKAAMSAEPTKTGTSGELGTMITAIGKAIVETDAKIAAAHDKLKAIERQQRNLDKYSAAAKNDTKGADAYEAYCLTRDVNTVMRRVQVHLALLDPQHVSEDLLALKDKLKTDTDTPPKAETDTPGSGNKEATAKPKFDLSDLDPNKIVSVCDIGV